MPGIARTPGAVAADDTAKSVAIVTVLDVGEAIAFVAPGAVCVVFPHHTFFIVMLNWVPVRGLPALCRSNPAWVGVIAMQSLAPQFGRGNASSVFLGGTSSHRPGARLRGVLTSSACRRHLAQDLN